MRRNGLLATCVAIVGVMVLFAFSASALAAKKLDVKGLTVGAQELTEGTSSHNPAASMLDRNYDTRWTTTGQLGTSWAEFDLGSPQTADRLRMAFEVPGADYSLKITAGDSPAPTTEVFAGTIRVSTVPKALNNIDFSSGAVTARYIRVAFTAAWVNGPDTPPGGPSSPGNWFGVWEAQVVNTAANTQTCTNNYSDDFNGSTLDSKWLRHTRNGGTPTSSTTVADGVLTMPTGDGELDAGGTGPINFIGQDLGAMTAAVGTNWVAETEFEIDFRNTSAPYGWTGAGFMVWAADNNFFRYNIARDNGNGRIYIEASQDWAETTEGCRDQSAGNPTISPAAAEQAPVRLRMRLVRGNTDAVAAQYQIFDREDQTWSNWSGPLRTGNPTSGGFYIPWALDLSPGSGVRRDSAGTRIGVYAGGNFTAAQPADVKFDYVRFGLDSGIDCEDDTTAPVSTATVTPAAPDGADGWYVTTPKVAVSSSDAGAFNNEVVTRYSQDAGSSWQRYSAPVNVTTESDDFEFLYRASDQADNEETAKTIALKVDTAAPTVTADTVATEGNTELTLEATDDASGLDGIEYSLDEGANWAPYTSPVDFSTAGDYEASFRASDVAGNVSEIETVSFNVSEAVPTKVLIYTGTTGYRHGGSGTIGGSTQAIHPDVVALIQSELADVGIESDWEDCDGYTIPPATPTNADHCNFPDKNARIFAPSNLEQYDAIYLFNASSKWSGRYSGQGILFSDTDRAAIIDFVNNGGGIAASHNAVDAGAGSPSWNWWDAPMRSVVGSVMPGHASTSSTGNLAPFSRESDTNPLTANLTGLPWLVGDEHYNFSTPPRPYAHVLGTFDESAASYNPGGNAMGADHPIAWCKPYDGGRSWVSGIGHFAIRYTEGTPAGNNNLMKLVVNGIRWVANDFPGADDACDYTDTTAPATMAAVTPVTPDGSNGWYTAAPSVALNTADDSGYTPAAGLETESRIGSAAFAAYDEPFTVSTEGSNVLEYQTTDATGNIEATKSATIKLDSVKPVASHTLTPGSGPYSVGDGGVELTLSGSDATSGVATLEYNDNSGSGWHAYSAPVDFTAAGSFDVDYRATDAAGNVSDLGSVEFTIEADATEPCFRATDEFDGTSLDEDRWQRHTRNGGTPTTGPMALSLDQGVLTLPTNDWEIDNNSATTARGPINSITQDISDWGDAWEVETQFSIEHTGGWQGVGLIAWQADNNFFRSSITNSLSASSRTIYVEQSKDIPGGTDNEGTRVTAGGNVNIQVGGTPKPIRIGMKYIKTAGSDSLASQYRIFDDGTETWGAWTNFPATSGTWSSGGGLNLAPAGADPITRIGLSASGNFPGEPGTNAYSGTPAMMNVEFFKVTPEVGCADTTAPVTTHTMDPATADGPGSAWLPGVELSLSAIDDMSVPGDVSTEYSLDEGATWVAYTGPVVFNDTGSHKVLYRSTDGTGNVETAKEVTFTVATEEVCTAYGDEFDGGTLASKWWRHTRNGGTPASATVVSGGKLVMPAGAFEIDTDNPTTGVGPVNFVGQDLNAITAEVGTTWEAETQMTVDFKTAAAPHGWQHAGLMVWNGTDVTGPDNNHFRFTITRNNTDGHVYVQGSRDVPGGTGNEGSRAASSNDPTIRPNGDTVEPVTIRLRLTRSGGDLVVGSYSLYDSGSSSWGAWVTMANSDSGSGWRQGGGGLNLAPAGGPRLDAPGGKIGIIAGGQFDAAIPAEVSVDYFHVTPDEVVPCPAPDSVAPESSHAIAPALPASGWYSAAPEVTLTATDDVSGVDRIEYRVGTTGTWTAYGAGPVSVTQQGANIFQYRAVDNAGNVEEINEFAVPVDTSGPVVNHVFTPAAPDAPDGTSWLAGVTAGIDAADAHSGVDSVEYSIDGGDTWVAYDPGAKPVFNEDGVQELQYRATDLAGNVSDIGVVVFNVGDSGTTPGGDNVPPVTSVTTTPVLPDGSDGWYKTKPVSVAMAAIDAGPGATGVDSIRYRVGTTGAFQTYTAPVSLSVEGVNELQYFATDNEGNIEDVKSALVKIDSIAPTSTVSLNPAYPGAGEAYNGDVKFSFAASDATSGIDRIEYRVNGAAFTPYTGGNVTVSAETDYTVEYRAIDKAGNIQATQSIEFSIDSDAVVNPPIIPVPVDPQDSPFAVNLQIAPNVAFAQYSVDYSRDGGITWEQKTPWSAYAGTLSFADGGEYKLHYRSQDLSGAWSAMNTMSFTVKGTPPPPTTLRVKVSPKNKKVKAGKKVNITVRVTNTGANPATAVEVCAKTQKKKAKLKGAACKTIDLLGVGQAQKVKFKFTKTAKGKKAKLKFTIKSPDAKTVKAKAQIRRK